MRKTLIGLICALAWPVLAAGQVSGPTYTFTVLTLINPDEVNANFTTIYQNALNRTGGTMTGTLTSRNIVPDTNNSRDLGASGTRYANVYSVLGNFSGALTAGSTLAVTGATTLSSTLGVTGATTLSSTLGVTGATTLSSTLGVTGAATLSSTLGVTGDATFLSRVGIGAAPSSSVGVGNIQISGGVLSSANPVSYTGNIYYDSVTDSRWEYYGNGYGIVIQENGSGGINFLTAPNNVSGAGAAATMTTRFTIGNAGTVTIPGSLVINGAALAGSLSTGNNNNVDPGSRLVALYNGPTTNGDITGFSGGVDGRILIVAQRDSLGGSVRLMNEDANSTAANRITVVTGASNFTLTTGRAAMLVYNGSTSRWLAFTLF